MSELLCSALILNEFQTDPQEPSILNHVIKAMTAARWSLRSFGSYSDESIPPDKIFGYGPKARTSQSGDS